MFDVSSIIRFHKGVACSPYAGDLVSKLGGKGGHLVEMAAAGLNVPPGLIIPCIYSVYPEYKDLHEKKANAVFSAYVEMTCNHFDGERVLVSVRSGAPVSMPGMMDTILNVGMTSETFSYYAEKLGFQAACDCYCRLIRMYANVVDGVGLEVFDHVKDGKGVEAIEAHKQVYMARTGNQFPDTMKHQLQGAIKAVTASWNNERAVTYRNLHNIPHDMGTAVIVQAMVFGNSNANSGTGVVFSRCPATGEKKPVGEFMVMAQGEDIVSGSATPSPLSAMQAWNADAYNHLLSVLSTLEKMYGDMQDVEFTVQDSCLYILQTRSGKRTPRAAFRIALDMVKEGVISTSTAANRVSRTMFDDAQIGTVIESPDTPAPTFTGIPAGGGAVTGAAVFTPERAVKMAAAGQKVILIRKETVPDDIAGMNAAVGILTSTGGLTSHAAVVARGMGKTCVVGATGLGFLAGKPHYKGMDINSGDTVTICGTTGRVWIKQQPVITPAGLTPEMVELLKLISGDELIRIHPAYWLTEFERKETASLAANSRVVVDTESLWGSEETLSEFLLCLPTDVKQLVFDISVNTNSRTYAAFSTLGFFGGLVPRSPQSSPLRRMERIHAALTVYRPDLVWVTSYINAGCTMDTDTVNAYASKHGLTLLGSPLQVHTLAQLMNAECAVAPSSTALSTVFGSMDTFKELVALLEAKKGISLTPETVTAKYPLEFIGA